MNKKICAPSEIPGHPPSLIRVFAVRMKNLWVFELVPKKRTAKTLIRLGGCPGWSESSLGAQILCWFCRASTQIKRFYNAIISIDHHSAVSVLIISFMLLQPLHAYAHRHILVQINRLVQITLLVQMSKRVNLPRYWHFESKNKI